MASGIEQSNIPSTILIHQILVNKTGVRQRDRFAREAAVVPSILDCVSGNIASLGKTKLTISLASRH